MGSSAFYAYDGIIGKSRYILNCIVSLAIFFIAVYVGLTFTRELGEFGMFALLCVMAAAIMLLLFATIQRVNDCKAAEWIPFLLFIPGLNIVLMFYLCTAPSRS